jgi:hypothetical protein
MNADGSCNILDPLLAQVVEGEVELVAHYPADADPARLGQGFEP